MPDLPIQRFCSYLTNFSSFQEAEAAGNKGLVTELQVAESGWLALQSVFEDVAHVCPYSDGYVQPLVCSGSIPGSIAEERQQVCLGGTRELQAHNSAKPRVKDFGPGLRKLTAACH